MVWRFAWSKQWLLIHLWYSLAHISLACSMVARVGKSRATGYPLPQSSLYFFSPSPQFRSSRPTKCLPQWAISELLFVSVSRQVLVLTCCKGNKFDSHKNTQLISIRMVVHQDSLWNYCCSKSEMSLCCQFVLREVLSFILDNESLRWIMGNLTPAKRQAYTVKNVGYQTSRES